MGYDFDTIPRRTYAQLNVLQLGWVVDMERAQNGVRGVGSGSVSMDRKRSHKQSIRERLRAMN